MKENSNNISQDSENTENNSPVSINQILENLAEYSDKDVVVEGEFKQITQDGGYALVSKGDKPAGITLDFKDVDIDPKQYLPKLSLDNPPAHNSNIYKIVTVKGKLLVNDEKTIFLDYWLIKLKLIIGDILFFSA